MMKKTISLILALMLLAGLTTGPVAAAQPSFTITLEDGSPLETRNALGSDWLLVPSGADRIQIHIDPKVDKAAEVSYGKLEPDDEDGKRYTLTLDGTRVMPGEDLDLFLRELSIVRIGAAQAPDKLGWFKTYETGVYSSVSIKVGEERTTLYICWQAGLPMPENLSIRSAAFYTPFLETDTEQNFVLDKNAKEAVISFTPSPDAVKVYLQDENFKTMEKALKQTDGISSFTVREADFGDNAVITRYLVLENEKGNKQIIAFNGARRLVDSPDAVVDYMCVGSQYSEGGLRFFGIFGLYPEKSLIGRGFWWSPISLGNFGSYITYYYEKPIRNDPQNPYGIDFIVYGNSNGGAGFSEPGNVLVSKDGETWYTLAGSDHYEDATKWGFTAVYTRGENGSTNADGRNMAYLYPSPGNYPLYDWSRGEDEITVSGVGLPARKDHHAAFPAFGYADVRVNSPTSWGTGEIVTLDSRAKNPYLPVTERISGTAPPDMEGLYEGAGDCFDLAWAVDEKGLPVELKEIRYIKVQTASLTTDASAIGEKSTEVNVVARAIGDKAAVGVSKPPAKISVGGTSLPLKAGVYQYAAAVKGPFTVQVEADTAVNVYINNQRAPSRDFAVAPDKGIVRIIVQEGEKEPLIYYITVNSDPLAK